MKKKTFEAEGWRTLKLIDFSVRTANRNLYRTNLIKIK